MGFCTLNYETLLLQKNCCRKN